MKTFRNWKLWPAWVGLAGLFLMGFTASAQIAARKILPNDILAIRVVAEPDLSIDRRVGDDGKITYPYLGVLTVADKTLAEVEREIQRLLNEDYIVDPQVTVEYREYVKQYVTVIGQVNQPGPIELLPDRRMDVIEVIAAARDLTRQARKTIVLNRKGVEFKFNYDDIKSNTDLTEKFFVEPGDVISVGERIF